MLHKVCLQPPMQQADLAQEDEELAPRATELKRMLTPLLYKLNADR